MTFEVDGRIYIKLDRKGELNSHDKMWDDGAGGQMKQILLWHDSRFISGIQTICERNGVNQISKKHGGTEGNFEMIKLRRPLTWVSGHYGSYCIDPELFVDEEAAPWNYYKVITSLKFGNEEETYGPFGLQNGTPFVFRAGSEITGFHGYSSDAARTGFGYISSIGLYFRTEAVSSVGEPSRSSTEQNEAQGTLIEGETNKNLCLEAKCRFVELWKTMNFVIFMGFFVSLSAACFYSFVWQNGGGHKRMG